VLLAHGRSWADIGPALMVEALMRMLGWHVFRGGPGRRPAGGHDDDTFTLGQPMLPGALSRLRFGAYRVGRGGPPVCVVTDTADGTVTVVLAVQGTGGALRMRESRRSLSSSMPPASSTNWCCPGWSTPFRGVIRFVAEPKFPVPLALVYWSDQVPRSTGALPRLKSSMKSFVYGAPLLPPPP